jgi:hypothetical protein
VVRLWDSEQLAAVAPADNTMVTARGRRTRDISEDDESVDLDAELPPKEWYLLEVWPRHRHAADAIRASASAPRRRRAGRPFRPDGRKSLCRAVSCDYRLAGRSNSRSLR